MVAQNVPKDELEIKKLLDRSKEKWYTILKERIRAKDFPLDFSLQKRDLGFVLDSKYDWGIYEKDGELLLVPLKKEE